MREHRRPRGRAPTSAAWRTSTTSPSPSIAGGNQRLPLALAEELGVGGAPGRRRSRRSEWGDARPRAHRRPARSRRTPAWSPCPPSVLDRIAFEPALPEPLRRALGLVEYGHAAKLFVPLRTPAAPSAVMNVPERYWTWTATGAGDEPQPVVSAFAGSSARARARSTSTPGRAAGSTRSTRLRADLELDPSGARALHLGRRPLGARGLLDLAAARGGGGQRSADRPARLRRRAHRRRAPRRSWRARSGAGGAPLGRCFRGDVAVDGRHLARPRRPSRSVSTCSEASATSRSRSSSSVSSRSAIWPSEPRVARAEAQPHVLVRHHLAQAAGVGHQAGAAGRHRLERHQPERLVDRRAPP